MRVCVRECAGVRVVLVVLCVLACECSGAVCIVRAGLWGIGVDSL